MSTARRTSPPVLIIAALSGLLALLLWAALAATVFNLHSSDAAGNGLAQVYAVVNTFALWLALLVLTIVAVARGGGAGWMKAGAMILCVASCAACIGALQLLTARGDAAVKWPVIVPLLAPPLLIAYGAWALVPTAQQSISVTAAALAFGIPLLTLSLAPWPSVIERAQRIDRQRAANESKFAQQLVAEREARRQEKLARMATFTDATPLWEWLGLIDRDSPVREEAIARTRALPRRQADAELMLARGATAPLLEAAAIDLQATPAFCASARTYLRERATNLRPSGDPVPYTAVAGRIEMFVPALDWLKAKGCDCGSEVAAIDDVVRAYPDSPERRQFLDRLARLR
jgi:hypothetical protein